MDPEKKNKLAEEGYEFDSDLECYVNRNAGKIFSKAWGRRQESEYGDHKPVAAA